MKSITFLFPSPCLEPAGGYKMVYEYANRLVADGYCVNIVYAGSVFWCKKILYYEITNCIRYIQRWWNGYSSRGWFNLDSRVREYFALSLNYRHVPKSDIYIATSPITAVYLRGYKKGTFFYFIQGYENWGGITDRQLRETYHYPMHKIVVSTWLRDIMLEEGIDCSLIPNGFDFDYFQQTIPIREKDKYKIAMIYSPIENKGSRYGLEALSIVKERYPQLIVTLFGSAECRLNLPDWMSYLRFPNQELHNRIYNEGAIFLATSIQEGWGLPVGEAMMCGQAVVCTDNKGYREMAKDGINALVCPVKDSQSLANAILRLIEDDELRYRIAENGYQRIQEFSLEKSYQKLKSVLQIN